MKSDRTTLKRVLIIESDQGMRKLLQTYVKNFDAKNIESCTPEQVDVGDLQNQSYDLIVLDWKAKGVSPHKLYQAIRQGSANQETPLVLTSGTITREDINIASADPRSSFVVKPCTEEVFRKTVQDLLHIKAKPVVSDKNLVLFKGQPPAKGHDLSIHKSDPKSAGKDLQDSKKQGEGFSAKEEKASGQFGFDLNLENSEAKLDFDIQKELQKQSTRTEFPTQGPRPPIAPAKGVQDEKNKRKNTEEGKSENKTNTPSPSPRGVQTPATSPSTKGPQNPIEAPSTKTPQTAPVVDDMMASLIQNKIEALQASIFASDMKVLIIEEKEYNVDSIRSYLKKIANSSVEVAADGKHAWKVLQKNRYNMIVMSWRLRGLSGLCLYNRIRSDAATQHIPIIILSGQMNKEDFRILEESSSTRAVSSPLDFKHFEEAVKGAFQAHVGVSKIASVAGLAIDQAMQDGIDLFGAIHSTSAKIPYRFEFFLAAGQYLSFRGELDKAEKVLDLASRINPDNVTVMTELAKVHLRKKRPVDSLALLARANEFSPGNVERLCLMGEVGLDLFKTDEARDFFTRALEIDEDHPRAKDGVVVANNLEQFLKTQEDPKPLQGKLASTLNLVGIAFVRNEQITSGIQQYISALAFVHDLPTIARVQFNLALAYLRNQSRDDAIAWLVKAAKNADEDFTKPKEVLARLSGGLDWEFEEPEWEGEEDFTPEAWNWDTGKAR